MAKVEFSLADKRFKRGAAGLRKRRVNRGFKANGGALGHAKAKQDDVVQVRVLAFSEVKELARARRTIEASLEKGEALVVVASATVYNTPEFRKALAEKNVRVVVEDPEEFDLEDLEPWRQDISGIIEDLGKAGAGEPAHRDSYPDALLRDEGNGRLDARKVSELFGMTIPELAELLGVTRQAIYQRPMARGIQEKLHPYEEIAQMLHWFGGDMRKFRAWLERPNNEYVKREGKLLSPLDLIRLGHANVVAARVRDQFLGNPA